jgi:hypothetical protein
VKTNKIIAGNLTVRMTVLRISNFPKNPNNGGKLPKDINININIAFEKLSNLSI